MKVALTFDDGPSEWTEQILDLLTHHDAHATFFVCGWAIPGRGDLLRRMVAEGHDIGNHTYNHPRLPTLHRGDVHNELALTQHMIAEVTGTRPVLWRAPYFEVGTREHEIADTLGLTHVGATVAPPDFTYTTPQILAQLRVHGVRDGEIIDLHDGLPPDGGSGHKTRQPTVDAVAEILSNDWEFVTIGELWESTPAR